MKLELTLEEAIRLFHLADHVSKAGPDNPSEAQRDLTRDLTSAARKLRGALERSGARLIDTETNAWRYPIQRRLQRH